MSTVRARLEADLEKARAEFETVRTSLETQLAETERDIIAIRRKRNEHAASLDEAGRRINALEEANAQAARIRQVTEARLEEVTKQLDTANQELVHAKAEADSCRLEAQLAGERVSTLENRVLELEAAGEMRPAPSDSNRHTVLSRIKKGLEDLGSARPDEILSRLLEHLSNSFAVAAVFAVETKGLRLWKACSGDSAVAIPAELSLESEFPVARAFRHRTTVSVNAVSGDGETGQLERPLGNAIAVPIIAQERVIAVAFAENPPNYSDDLAGALEAVAEILVGCVNQRLNRNQPSVEAQPSAEVERAVEDADTPSVAIESGQYAVSRQARRVKINSSVEVLVDGIASMLVDISELGAQIVSTTSLRPNRCVRIALPNGGSRLNCEGRIVWSKLEGPRADAPVVYRAGVRFVDVNLRAITTFVSELSPAETLAVNSV